MKPYIETLSTQIIKPSSETPYHLRKLKLSYLDQLLIPIYTPVIFFYEADESKGLICSNHSQISQQLKQSLADTLTSFYPLAGRIESNFLVDCNDVGAEFIEARAHARLMDLVNDRDVKHMKHFLPRDPRDFNGTLVLAKLTFFECGGISIGVCISHKFADFASVMAFINAWAATSRGAPNFVPFSFDLADHFPARDLPEPGLWTFAGENDVAKTFLFDKELLADLKCAAISPYVENPTRVEAVSAFLWKNFIEVIRARSPNSKGVFFAPQAMNLRSRISPPPHLENVFGNCYMATMAVYDPDNVVLTQDHYQELVRVFRDAIQMINGDFIREAQFGNSYLNMGCKLIALQVKGELRDGCAFTSWSKFPVYEVDLGWGNPVWVGTTMPVKNSVVLVDTRCGEGIEVWVNMERDVVEMLENQINLISTTG